MFSLAIRNAARTSRLAPAAAASVAGTRGYSVGSHMSDNDPEVIEKEKKRNLDGNQHDTSTPHDHAPGWNEHLASVSEAHVKADKDTATPEEMQQSTVSYVKARHHAGEEEPSGSKE